MAVPNEATVVLRLWPTLNQHNLGRFRLSLTGAGGRKPEGRRYSRRQCGGTGCRDPKPQAVGGVGKYYRAHVANPAKATELVTAKRKQLADLRKKLPTVMVMEEIPAPRKAFILNRGQYDQPAEEVKAGLPAFLPAARARR